MSRVGKKPISIPKGVTITANGDNTIAVKGPKGNLVKKFKPEIKIVVEKDEVKISRSSDLKAVRALHGATRMLLANMITGVSEGFEKDLEAVGVGYRFAMQGNDLQISLGFSHPISYRPPEGIKLAVSGQNGVKIAGVDKDLVGKVAAEIRDFRGPEPYKGKGVKYKGEHIIRKAGKAGKAAGAGAAA